MDRSDPDHGKIVAFLGDKTKRGNPVPVHINTHIFIKETKITWIPADTTASTQLFQTPGMRTSLIQTATPTSSVPLSTTQAVLLPEGLGMWARIAKRTVWDL